MIVIEPQGMILINMQNIVMIGNMAGFLQMTDLNYYMVAIPNYWTFYVPFSTPQIGMIVKTGNPFLTG
jgi:hypothetical protein